MNNDELNKIEAEIRFCEEQIEREKESIQSSANDIERYSKTLARLKYEKKVLSESQKLDFSENLEIQYGILRDKNGNPITICGVPLMKAIEIIEYWKRNRSEQQ